MIQRVSEVQNILKHVSVDYSGLPALKEIDFSLLKQIIEVLRPVEKITKKLSGRDESFVAFPKKVISVKQKHWWKFSWRISTVEMVKPSFYS